MPTKATELLLRQSKQPDLFDICARNHQGNEMSVRANRVTDKSKDRVRILEYLGSVADATCDEVELALGLNHQTCSARLSELKMGGVIVPTTKRPTRTGCLAQAWRPSEQYQPQPCCGRTLRDCDCEPQTQGKTW